MKNSWDDVAYITATVIDQNGVLEPRSNDMIHFSISGPGVIAAVENGDPANGEPFVADHHTAFAGRCVAILRASGEGGKIEITAAAGGLKSGSMSLLAETADQP